MTVAGAGGLGATTTDVGVAASDGADTITELGTAEADGGGGAE